VERLVSPGSYVQTGTEVATLYSSEQVEIALPLPDNDWNNIPDDAALTGKTYPVQLNSVDNKKHWQGRISRLEQHLDETTRQRTLVVSVDSPLDMSPPLFPGTFVQATIQGRKVSDLWRLPSSAISQRSEVWYMKADDTLASFATTPLFSDADFIYVAAPEALLKQTQKVVLQPLNSYVQGMKIQPVVKNMLVAANMRGEQDE